jgi:hypothetical protein
MSYYHNDPEMDYIENVIKQNKYMKTVRAKMQLSVVKDYGTWQELEFNAKYSDNKEDNTFSSATPSAKFTMTLSNPEVFGVMKPGKSYYFDMTPCEE